MPPFYSLLGALFGHRKTLIESYICSLLSHVNPATREIIARQAVLYSKSQVNVLAVLMVSMASEKTIGTIFSLINNRVLNEIALMGVGSKHTQLIILEISIKKSNPEFQTPMLTMQSNSIEAIIKQLQKETLIAFMKHPIHLDALRLVFPRNKQAQAIIAKIASDLLQQKPETVFLDILSNDTQLFNSYVRKILIEDDYFELTSKAISCLDEENLSLYIAQHPDISKIEGSTKAIDKSAFEARLQKSSQLVADNMAFLLIAQRELDGFIKSADLIKLVIDYLGMNQCYIKCLEHEATRENQPKKLAKLTAIYSEITHYFLHTLPLPFRANEALIVLMYLSKDSHVAEMAMRNVRMKPMSLPTKNPVKIGAKLLTGFTAFWNEKDLKTKACEGLQKLEIVKQGIADFVKAQNQVMEEKPEGRRAKGASLKTFEELEHYFKEKRNDKLLLKIKTLRQSAELANTQYQQTCLELILQDFTNPKKRPWTQAKKLFLTQGLITKCQEFGFEYTIQNDSHSFLQAIVQQLYVQKLSHLASSYASLYENMQHYLKSNLREYKDFLEKYRTYLNDYVEHNIELGPIFDKIMILTCSRVLNVNIAIITGDSLKPHIYKQPSSLGTLYLGQLHKEHYSLIENKALPKTKFLCDFMDASLDFESGSAEGFEVRLWY